MGVYMYQNVQNHLILPNEFAFQILLVERDGKI